MRSNFTDAAVEFGKRIVIGVGGTELLINVVAPAFGASRPESQVGLVLGAAAGGALYAAGKLAVKKFG